jgi:hypothetical protein
MTGSFRLPASALRPNRKNETRELVGNRVIRDVNNDFPGLAMSKRTTPSPKTPLSPVVATANPTIDRVRIDPFSSTSAAVRESVS